MGFLRKGWDSNPRSVISRTHDFQSCALDQLSHLCIYGFPWAIAVAPGRVQYAFLGDWTLPKRTLQHRAIQTCGGASGMLSRAYIVYHTRPALSRGIFQKSRRFPKKHGAGRCGTLRCRLRFLCDAASRAYFSMSPVCSSAVRKYSSSSASLMTVVLPRAYSLSTISFIRATMGSRLSIWRSMSCSWK